MSSKIAERLCARKRGCLTLRRQHVNRKIWPRLSIATRMALPQNIDKVIIRLFKEDGHLVVQYSVTNLDRHSEQCRDDHVDSLRTAYRRDFTDPERSDRLKIKCASMFEAEPNGSSKIWSLTEGDAIFLCGYFLDLNVVIMEDEGKWELRLDEEYNWQEWRRGIARQSYATCSSGVRVERSKKRSKKQHSKKNCIVS